MNKYWYKHFYKTYSELLESNPAYKTWLESDLKEYTELLTTGSSHRHGVLYFYNGDKSFYEGITNALNHLLGNNSWIYAKI